MNKQIYHPKSEASAGHIPPWLFQAPSKLISAYAKLLYCRLAQWTNEKGHAHRSVSQLAREMDRPSRSIERYLKELRDLGLIGTFQVKMGGVNHFEFYFHEWMNLPLADGLEYKYLPGETNVNSVGLPPSNMSEPHDNSTGEPPSKVATLNKRNKNNKNIYLYNTKKISELHERNLPEEKSETDFPQTNNQPLEKNQGNEALDESNLRTKSDYQKNQTKDKSNCSKLNKFGVNDILSDNPFQIPAKYIYKWVSYRKDNNNPIDEITWEITKKQLAQCKTQGKDPIEAFESMVVGNWPSLKTDWPKSSNKPEEFQWTYDAVERA